MIRNYCIGFACLGEAEPLAQVSAVIILKMKKYLLQVPGNEKWVASQERRRSENESNALIRRAAFPELSQSSRSAISVEDSRKRIEKLTNESMCREIVLSMISLAIPVPENVQAQSIPKTKVSNQKYQTSTWKDKSYSIFYYLHPSLGNLDAEVTCLVFGVKNGTFTNWITKKEFYAKWLPFVSTLTLRDVFVQIPLQYREKFSENNLELDSKVEIPSRYTSHGEKRYITAKFGPGESRQKRAKAAASVSNVTYITETSRSVGSGRKLKYATEVEFLFKIVRDAWEVGNPLSRSEIYLSLMREFGNNGVFPQTEFCFTMKLDSGSISPALSQWVKRQLVAQNWSFRKESVSQKVPWDWYRLALVASQDIRGVIKDCDIVINADEVCMNFYHRDT